MMNWPHTAMLILEIAGVLGLLWKIRAFQYLKYRREKAIVAAIAFAIVVPITFHAYELWGWRIKEQWLVHRINVLSANFHATRPPPVDDNGDGTIDVGERNRIRGEEGKQYVYKEIELGLELKLLRLSNSSDPSEREEARIRRLIEKGVETQETAAFSQRLRWRFTHQWKGFKERLTAEIIKAIELFEQQGVQFYIVKLADNTYRCKVAFEERNGLRRDGFTRYGNEPEDAIRIALVEIGPIDSVNDL